MNRQKGLTLLEILAVLVVLGVVAGITVPKFRLALLQSRESKTKMHLGDLRGALAIYYSDNSGVFPAAGALDASITPRYLKQIPYVVLPHLYPSNKNSIQNELNDAGDWLYADGFIGVNSTKMDSKGRAVSSW